MRKLFSFLQPYGTTLQEEIERASVRYHVIGAWVAIIFDPIFALTDYLNIPYAWWEIFMLRIGVSVITLLVLLLYKRFNFPSATLVSVPFLLISLQNAYTYSLIQQADFLAHTLNYIALFIGAGMFILWRWYYSAIIVALSMAATFYYIRHNEAITSANALLDGGLLLLVTSLFMIFLIRIRYSSTVKIIEGKLALAQANHSLGEANTELAEQKKEIESKNRSITDSIRYASRIQQSIMPLPEEMDRMLGAEQYFVLNKPKDIVSGDFYFCEEVQTAEGSTVYLAAADCTGHGVPGALMSMIGSQALSENIQQLRIEEPHKILQQLHYEVTRILKQKETKTNDGMDIALVALDKNAEGRTFRIRFAGAKNSLLYIQNGELHELKADRKSIGGRMAVNTTEHSFTCHEIVLNEPFTGYLFSDGYRDQMGGPNNRKFGSAQLRDLLSEVYTLPMAKQKDLMDKIIQEWLGTNRQIDDILVIGFRV